MEMAAVDKEKFPYICGGDKGGRDRRKNRAGKRVGWHGRYPGRHRAIPISAPPHGVNSAGCGQCTIQMCVAAVRKTGEVVTSENYSTIGAYSTVSETLTQEYPVSVVRTALARPGKMDYLRQALASGGTILWRRQKSSGYEKTV